MVKEKIGITDQISFKLNGVPFVPGQQTPAAAGQPSPQQHNVPVTSNPPKV